MRFLHSIDNFQRNVQMKLFSVKIDKTVTILVNQVLEKRSEFLVTLPNPLQIYQNNERKSRQKISNSICLHRVIILYLHHWYLVNYYSVGTFITFEWYLKICFENGEKCRNFPIWLPTFLFLIGTSSFYDQGISNFVQNLRLF